MKYICPICGKFYSKPADLAACVQKCANEADNKEQRAAALYSEINKAYTSLKGLIGEYNALGTDTIFTSTLNHTAKKPTEKPTEKPAEKPTFIFKSYRPDWSVLDSWNIGGGDKAGQVKFSNKLDADTDSEFEKFLKDTLKIEKPNFKNITTSSKNMTDSANDAEEFMEIFNRLMEVFGESDETKKSL